MPKDDAPGWTMKSALPIWKRVPTPVAVPALTLGVGLLAVIVYLGLRLDGMKVAQGTLERRISALEGRPSGDPAALSVLTAGVTATSERIATLEVTPRADPDVLAALVTRVAALEAKPAGDPSSLAALASRIDASTAGVAALADRMAALTDRTVALEARPAGDPAAVSALSARLDAAATRVSALEAAPRIEPAALAALDGRVAALTDRTGGLEARPAGDPTALDLLTAGLDAAVIRIVALEALPRSEPAPVKAIESQVTALSGRLSAIEADRTAAKTAANTPPAPAAAAPVEAGWIVLGEIRFDRGSFVLGAPALADIATIAKASIESGRHLVLRGYADRVGNPVFNQALSLRRAIAVQQALIDQAVPAAQFHSVDGYGEDALPVRTGDEKPEPGNRIVVVFGATAAPVADRPAKN